MFLHVIYDTFLHVIYASERAIRRISENFGTDEVPAVFGVISNLPDEDCSSSPSRSRASLGA